MMSSKTISVLGVFFILMLAATLVFADDQFTTATYKGNIVRLQWSTVGAAQLQMSVQWRSGPVRIFIVNTQTLIDINGRVAGPKELLVGDFVTVQYGNNIAFKVSVTREESIVKMACVIEEIRFTGANYVFVMEAITRPNNYYELIVTPSSKLMRNGQPADASEFQAGDFGTARFRWSDLKILSFSARTPDTN